MKTILEKAVAHELDDHEYEQLEAIIENDDSISFEDLKSIWALGDNIIQRTILQNTSLTINAYFRKLAFENLDEVLAFSLCHADNLTESEKSALLNVASKEVYADEGVIL